MKSYLIIAFLISLVALVYFIAYKFLYYFLWGHGYYRKNPIYKDGQIKVACVGDSTTYGNRVFIQPLRNYPKVLNRLLGNRYCVHNYGVNAACACDDGDVPYINSKVYSECLEFEPDILVMMLGTNDSKLFNYKKKRHFIDKYTELLENFISLGCVKTIYLCSPCKVYKESYEISAKNCEQICSYVRSISKDKHIRFIDINKITSNNEDYFGGDGIHPNGKGAKAIANEVYRQITKNNN